MFYVTLLIYIYRESVGGYMCEAEKEDGIGGARRILLSNT